MAKKIYAFYLDDSNYGIVETWDECKKIVEKTKYRYKSFTSKIEAENWIKEGAEYQKKEKIPITLEDGIYFDAGTGRGNGVEVKISDKNGKNLIREIFEETKNYDFISDKKFYINEFDNLQLDMSKTNNYGELIALFFAILYAKKNNINKIFGDSKLVIDFWSLGRYNKKNLNDETIALIYLTNKHRKEFESIGGKISYIPGDINPADLGFHK